MFNLIKMEVYRLFHMRSLYVLLAFMVVFAHFSVDGTNTELKEMKSNIVSKKWDKGPKQGTADSNNDQVDSENATEDVVEIDTVGISVTTDESWLEGFTLPEFLDSNYSSGLLMLFVAIFIPLFVAGEQKSGYVKNIVGQLPYRGQLALSKLVPVVLEIFMAFTVFALCGMIFSEIYMEEFITIGKLGEFAAVFGYHLLTHVAFGCLLAFLVLLLRGTSGAMVLGILLSMDFINIIYQKIDEWFGVKVSQYVLSTNMHTLVMEAGEKIIRQGVLVAVLFLIVSMACAMVSLQKRDIR